jgi:hypothetical protein
MSWLSAAWDRNKGAIVKIGAGFLAGGPAGAAVVLANDARQEAARVIARTGAPPEAQATLRANAENAINAASAAAGVNNASLSNPLGAQGAQVVAIGGRTVSVNTLALIALGVVLFIVVFFVARKR